MIKILAALALCIGGGAAALAQHGTAESGVYPLPYSGDTWTGEVTSINEDTREFTLTYKKGKKTETFVGVLPKSYKVRMSDGSTDELKMADLVGKRFRAYYIVKSKKVDGQKVKWNDVFKIVFVGDKQ